MDQNKQDVLDEIKSYGEECDRLLTLLGQGSLQGHQKLHAQSRLRKLKRGIDDRIRDCDRRLDDLNEYEQRYLYPLLREAASRIQVSDATEPLPRWRDELLSAGRQIAYVIDELERA